MGYGPNTPEACLFINKVLLEHSHAHLQAGCSRRHTTGTHWSGFSRDCAESLKGLSGPLQKTLMTLVFHSTLPFW